MPRTISGEYRGARRILTGSHDPSGLNLEFLLDGSQVKIQFAAPGNVKQRRVVAPSFFASICDDAAHATLAAFRKRVGVSRESRLRFLKPLYEGEAFKLTGQVSKENGDLFSLTCSIINARNQPVFEGATDIFALTADTLRRMTKDGMIPVELRRYLP